MNDLLLSGWSQVDLHFLSDVIYFRSGWETSMFSTIYGLG